MTAAIFGLLGVVAGGLITFTTQLMMLRRQRRERARIAARVITAELARIQAVLVLPALGPTPARLGIDEALAVWAQYRGDLAGLPSWEASVLALVALAAVAPLEALGPVPDNLDHLQGLVANAMRELSHTCEQPEPGLSVALWQWFTRDDRAWIRIRRRVIRKLAPSPERPR